MESQEIFLDRPGHTLLKRKRAKRQRRPASPITGSSSSTDKEDEDVANCLMLLSQGDQSYGPSSQTDQEHEDHSIDGVSKMDFSSAVKSRRLSEMGSNLYQCKTCDKVFSSFQALGGHRASHKKPNKAGAAAPEEGKIYRKITLDTTCASPSPSPDPTPNPHPGLELGIGIKANKVHECSICGTEFGSGQALGGHMRRHRSTNADVDESDKKTRNVLELDLNLPAPEEHDLGDSGYGFEPRQPTGLVLSATPLVDCRY